MAEEAKAQLKEGEKPKISPSQIGLLIGGILSLLLVIALIGLVIVQFGPKTVPEPDWKNYAPLLNPYPAASLVASNSVTDPNYKQIWKVYVSKDDLSKIKLSYTDQFLGINYKLDETNTVFPTDYFRAESNKCYYVRYGLDVSGLDELRFELPELDTAALKSRFPGQTLFVVQQFDTVTRDPTC